MGLEQSTVRRQATSEEFQIEQLITMDVRGRYSKKKEGNIPLAIHLGIGIQPLDFQQNFALFSTGIFGSMEPLLPKLLGNSLKSRTKEQ
jgi:hypothetical protein